MALENIKDSLKIRLSLHGLCAKKFSQKKAKKAHSTNKCTKAFFCFHLYINMKNTHMTIVVETSS